MRRLTGDKFDDIRADLLELYQLKNDPNLKDEKFRIETYIKAKETKLYHLEQIYLDLTRNLAKYLEYYRKKAHPEEYDD